MFSGRSVFDPSNEPPSSSPAPVLPGDFVGRYRVRKALGHGGMGVVVQAVDTELERPVALKFLLSTRMNDDSFLRFAREARATAQIASDHVVRVYDVGRTGDGQPYLVMESLVGQDLAELLEATGPLPVDRAVDLAVQACAGLAAAHRRGIIHRDIKPGNLFVEQRLDGTDGLRILDFGLAKPPATGVMTASNRLMGSPVYMSPEQIEEPEKVDARTDIWSLGIVLYEALTGQRPFRGATVIAICADVLTRLPDPPSSHVAGIPAELDRIVLRCIRRDREDRYTDVAELAEDLLALSSCATRELARRVRRILETPWEPVSIRGPEQALSAAAAAKAERRGFWGRLFPVALGMLVGALLMLATRWRAVEVGGHGHGERGPMVTSQRGYPEQLAREDLAFRRWFRRLIDLKPTRVIHHVFRR